jgi:sialic acid synthase SpsE
MSTGMATLEEIDHAISVLQDNGCKELAILRCSSAYPSNPKDMNLLNMRIIKDIYDMPIGVSDHSAGIGVAVAAAALGANIIEKHFTLDRKMDGPDHKFSMEPDDFLKMVQSVRQAEAAVRDISFNVHGELEYQSRVLFRRSLYIVENMNKGEILTRENLRCIRPGSGLAPKYFNQLIGMAVNKSISRGTPMSWDLVKST